MESELGIHDYYEALLNRPIYGALALGADEKATGAHNAESYGRCVITVKPDVARERTTYTYGDSMNIRMGRRKPEDWQNTGMVFEEAVAAKLYFERHRDPRRDRDLRYVEAQILGGVSIDDIESITIDWGDNLRHGGVMRMIRERYPSIKRIFRMTAEDLAQTDPQRIENIKATGGQIVMC